MSNVLAAEFIQSMSLPGVDVFQINLINLAKNFKRIFSRNMLLKTCKGFDLLYQLKFSYKTSKVAPHVGTGSCKKKKN